MWGRTWEIRWWKREKGEWVWTWEKVGRGGGKCDAFCVFFHGDLVRVDDGGGLGQRGEGVGSGCVRDYDLCAGP